MAISNITLIDPATDTFSDWVNKTNQIVGYLKTDIVTANTALGGGQTIGDFTLIGTSTANTVYVIDNLSGGGFNTGSNQYVTGLLSVTSNTTFTNACDLVTVENDQLINGNLTVRVESYLDGNVFANSYVTVIGDNANVQVNDGVLSLSRNDANATVGEITSTNIGTLIIEADKTNNAAASEIQLRVDGDTRAVLTANSYLYLYDDAVTPAQSSVWDGFNKRLGINTLTPTADLDVNGMSNTVNLNVTTHGYLFDANVATLTVDTTLAGNPTLNVISDTTFSKVDGLVDIVNNLDVGNNVTIANTLQVTSTSYLIGAVTTDTSLNVTGGAANVVIENGTLRITQNDADAANSAITSSLAGSLILDADKDNTGASSDIQLRIDDKLRALLTANSNFYLYDNSVTPVQSSIWDATTKRFGVNTLTPSVDLDVNGTTNTINLNVATLADINDAQIATLTVETSLTGAPTLDIISNTNFTQADGLVDITNNLHIGNTLIYVLKPTNYIHLEPDDTGQRLGNTSFQWDAYLANTVSYGYIRPVSNTVGTDLGSATQRFNLTGNTATLSGTLDVTGTTTLSTATITTENVTTSNITSLNAVSINVTSSISSSTGDLSLDDNVAVSGTLDVTGATTLSNATISGTLTYVIDDSNYEHLIPTNTDDIPDLLGNTTNRWDGYFNDMSVTGNITGNTATIDTLTVTSGITFPAAGDINLSGLTSFEDINVSGTANINNLSVMGLVTNTAAIIGEVATVTTNTETVIDSFDKSSTKGFKYIVHGTNAALTSTYMIEVMCAHNDTTVLYTRYGELENDFNITSIVPSINTTSVELKVVCPNASVANAHNFNIVRIETRDPA